MFSAMRTGRGLDGGDDAVGVVHRPMMVVAGARAAAAAFAHERGVGVGGAHVGVVDRFVVFRRHRLVQLGGLGGDGPFVGRDEFGAALDHRVLGGVRVDQAGVHMDFLPVHQPGLDTLLHGAQEDVFKDFLAPAGAGFGEDAVVRRPFVEVVAEEPEVIQALGQPLHQFAFAGHVIEEEQEHELGQDDGIDALVPVVAIETGGFGAHEGEVDDLGDAAQRVVLADAVFEVDPVAEELRLRLVDTHHRPDRIVARPIPFKLFPKKSGLGNRPARCARRVIGTGFAIVRPDETWYARRP